MSVTRRRFLGGMSALGGAAALGACGLGGDESSSKRSGPAEPDTTTTSTLPRSPAGEGTLVMITLDGGNDSLNTVMPVDDPGTTLAVAHSRLGRRRPPSVVGGIRAAPGTRWPEGPVGRDRLAIVHGVGFDDLDRSHFHCRDVWQAGSETDHQTGWVGRWLDAAGDSEERLVAAGREPPDATVGAWRACSYRPRSCRQSVRSARWGAASITPRADVTAG